MLSSLWDSLVLLVAVTVSMRVLVWLGFPFLSLLFPYIKFKQIFFRYPERPQLVTLQESSVWASDGETVEYLHPSEESALSPNDLHSPVSQHEEVQERREVCAYSIDTYFSSIDRHISPFLSIVMLLIAFKLLHFGSCVSEGIQFPQGLLYVDYT